MNLSVYFLPTLASPAELSQATVVVIDVLRATTTMLHALKSGASCVIPCLEIAETKQIAARSGDGVVLGGERGGVRIPGFHLGNSPAEYSARLVAGKTVVMTTTNGTRALLACGTSARVLIGAFANFSRLLSDLAGIEKLALLCAGTNGQITSEDILFAGAVVAELTDRRPAGIRLNDEARVSAAAWRNMVGDRANSERLVEVLKQSRGGRNLVQLGFEDDIRCAATIDSAPVRGELLWNDRRIVSR